MRLIVVAESTPSPGGGVLVVRPVFRYQVPAGREPYYANTALQKGLAPGDYGAGGKQVDELAALQQGQWFETFAPTERWFVAAATKAQIGADLQAFYAAASQAWLEGENAKLKFYGVAWDGATWS